MACDSDGLLLGTVALHEAQVYNDVYFNIRFHTARYDIDINLAPLIEDLKILCEEGIEVHDAYRYDQFRLKAIIFKTISDFLAYSNLFWFRVKKYYACPLCGEEIDHIRSKNCKKYVYMGK